MQWNSCSLIEMRGSSLRSQVQLKLKRGYSTAEAIPSNQDWAQPQASWTAVRNIACIMHEPWLIQDTTWYECTCLFGRRFPTRAQCICEPPAFWMHQGPEWYLMQEESTLLLYHLSLIRRHLLDHHWIWRDAVICCFCCSLRYNSSITHEVIVLIHLSLCLKEATLLVSADVCTLFTAHWDQR